MPSRLTEAHIEAEARLRFLVVGAVGQIWNSLPNHRDENLDQWLSSVVPVVHSGQRASVHLTDAYLARAMGRQPLGVSADKIIANARNGVKADEVYARSFGTVWGALGAGSSYTDSIAAGLARATGTAAMDVQLAARGTFQQVQEADDGIYGYQRVADGGACSFCSEIDGAYVKSGDASPLHDRCGCGLEPLTNPHPRAAFLPSGESVHDGFAIHEHGEVGPVLTDPDHEFLTV